MVGVGAGRSGAGRAPERRGGMHALFIVSTLASRGGVREHHHSARGHKRPSEAVSPAGIALLGRVGRSRVWLSIPPRAPVEDFLSVRARNYSGLPAEARLLPPYEFEALTHTRFAAGHGTTACMVRDPQLRVEQGARAALPRGGAAATAAPS